MQLSIYHTTSALSSDVCFTRCEVEATSQKLYVTTIWLKPQVELLSDQFEVEYHEWILWRSAIRKPSIHFFICQPNEAVGSELLSWPIEGVFEEYGSVWNTGFERFIGAPALFIESFN